MSDPRRWLDPASEAGDRARELLRRAPVAPPMSGEAKARIAAKITTATALPAAVGTSGTLGWKLLFGAGVIGLAGLALFWRTGFAHHHASHHPSVSVVPSTAPRPATQHASNSDQSARSLDPPTTVAAPPPAPAQSEIRAAATDTGTSRTTHGLSRRVEPPAAPTTRDELEIVQRASALVDRDPHAAIRFAREHEAHFPHGDYVEERESIVVRALANAGQHRAARDRAERFLRQYPASIYANRVRGILETLR